MFKFDQFLFSVVLKMDATMQLSEPTRLMLSRAVASSKRHGIKLTPGKLNPGLGNCAFEAVLHNINESLL